MPTHPSEQHPQRTLSVSVSPPAAATDFRHSLSAAAIIPTRRTERTSLLPDTPAAPRSTSRKRPAENATPDTRPPTKVTRTPHGELYRTTNGVLQPLGIADDDVPSGHSTPRPGSAGKLVVPAPVTAKDKRSLRSQDGGSRLKSDLATYFANYDDIIAGLQETSGM